MFDGHFLKVYLKHMTSLATRITERQNTMTEVNTLIKETLEGGEFLLMSVV